jgi:COP9 signalosome complex subunit 6
MDTSVKAKKTYAKQEISISLSPLVIMSITDHYTRLRYITESIDAKVYGVLLGQQHGKSIKILNTFETTYDEETKTIDKSFVTRRSESFSKLFPDFEIMGWYTTCTKDSENTITSDEQAIGSQFEVFRENPLFLKMNVDIKKRQQQATDVIAIFENNKTLLQFIIEPTETERIALDDAKKDISSTKDKSQLSVNLITTLISIKLLRKNVSSLINIIKNVPEIRKNHEIIRLFASICNRLPLVSDKAAYSDELFTEYSDTVLINQLGVLNKAIEQIQEFNSHKAMKNIDEIFG